MRIFGKIRGMKTTAFFLAVVAGAFALVARASQAPLDICVDGACVRVGNTNADMDFGMSAVPQVVSLNVRPDPSGRLTSGTAIRIRSLDFGYQPDAYGCTHARRIAVSSNGARFVSKPVSTNTSDRIACAGGKSAERLVYSFEDEKASIVVGSPCTMEFLDASGREMGKVRYKVVAEAESFIDDVSFTVRGKTYRPLVQLVGELVAPSAPAAKIASAAEAGCIKVRTIPAEVRVRLDGRFAGTTKPGSNDDAPSLALVLDDVPAGDHVLLLQHVGYEDLSVPVKVDAGKTVVVKKRVLRRFLPDVEVVSNGIAHRGVLVARDADVVTLEVKRGVNRSFRVSDIQKIVDIDTGK